jgi:hypothetical protein
MMKTHKNSLDYFEIYKKSTFITLNPIHKTSYGNSPNIIKVKVP